jgi:hypothetical protein
MLVVAIAGLAMGGDDWGYRMWRLSRAYAGLAQYYESLEILHWNDGMLSRQNSRGNDTAGSRDEVSAYMAHCAAKVVYYAALVRKYDRAARYPWLPVEPDAPEP